MHKTFRKTDSRLYKRIPIENYNFLRKSLNMMSMTIDSRLTPVLLSPLMLSNYINVYNGRYMNDRISMLYTHMMADPTVSIKSFNGNVKKYDTISYFKEDSRLVLDLTNGLRLTVFVNNKVKKYASKLVDVGTDLTAVLVSAMYIYSNLNEGYSYPIMIMNNNTAIVEVNDNLIGVKKDKAIDVAELPFEMMLHEEALKSKGNELLSICKKLNINYEKMTTIMSMLTYILEYCKNNYHSMYTNKYIDFIIMEIIYSSNKPNNKKINTIEAKRAMIKYILSYRVFISSAKKDN